MTKDVQALLGPKKRIRLNLIDMDEEQFQIRDFGANSDYISARSQEYRSADTVKRMLEKLNEQGRAYRLDPVYVIAKPDGRYVVVDGHHRYEAYTLCNWAKRQDYSIPVREFAGTPQEARLLALKTGQKARMQMSRSEEIEAAWRQIIDPPEALKRASVRELSTTLGISKSLVGQMKKRLDELEQKGIQDRPRWKEVAGRDWEAYTKDDGDPEERRLKQIERAKQKARKAIRLHLPGMLNNPAFWAVLREEAEHFGVAVSWKMEDLDDYEWEQRQAAEEGHEGEQALEDLYEQIDY
nr:ParB/RepB/Spo0J family partition protein [Chromobacterium sp. ASV5]